MFDFFGPVVLLLVPAWYIGVLILLLKIWQELKALRVSRGL
jgi:hypothetical protein